MTQTYFYLLNHLWQSTLVAGAAWLACGVMLRSNSAQIRFAVWLAACAKFLIPFAVFVEAGRRLNMSRPLALAGSQHIFNLVHPGNVGLAMVPFPMAGSPEAPALSLHVLLTGIAAVWVLGSAAVLLQCLAGWWTIRRAEKDAVLSGSFRGIPILKSRTMRDQRIDPGVFGIWRQTILIPDGVENSLSGAQFQALLLHEWNHARRRDNLAAVIEMLAETIFWFYPMIWMVGRKLNEERELACDQAVLEDAQPGDAEAYAEGILNVCKLYTAVSRPCVAGITGANLRARVAWILKHEQPRPLDNQRCWVLAGSLVAAIIGPAIIGFLTAPAFAQQGNSFVQLATAAQVQAETPRFEVTSVKACPAQPDGRRRSDGLDSSPDRLHLPCQTLVSLIHWAFVNFADGRFNPLASIPISGGPSWIRSDLFEIDAKSEMPQGWGALNGPMLRSLLQQRFHLRMRKETQEVPVYAITLASGGAKLQASRHDCINFDRDNPPQPFEPDKPIPAICGQSRLTSKGWEAFAVTMEQFATLLSGNAGRTLVDRTGLRGTFDIRLDLTVDDLRIAGRRDGADQIDGPPEQPDTIATIRSAVRTLGLRIESSKGSGELLVIDGAEKPSAN